MFDPHLPDSCTSSGYPSHDIIRHLAEYAIIAPFIKDKIVLNIARNPRYGSDMMRRAGARRVIDIYHKDINAAEGLSITDTSMLQGFRIDPAHPDQILEPSSFDIVISIDTIGQAKDSEHYLSMLKHVAKPDAVFLIFCTNGLWNTHEFPPAAAYFDMGMDAYVRTFCALAYYSTNGFQSSFLREREKKLELEQQLEERTRELRHTKLRLSAIQSENTVIRKNIETLMKENIDRYKSSGDTDPLEPLSRDEHDLFTQT